MQAEAPLPSANLSYGLIWLKASFKFCFCCASLSTFVPKGISTSQPYKTTTSLVTFAKKKKPVPSSLHSPTRGMDERACVGGTACISSFPVDVCLDSIHPFLSSPKRKLLHSCNRYRPLRAWQQKPDLLVSLDCRGLNRTSRKGSRRVPRYHWKD